MGSVCLGVSEMTGGGRGAGVTCAPRIFAFISADELEEPEPVENMFIIMASHTYRDVTSAFFTCKAGWWCVLLGRGWGGKKRLAIDFFVFCVCRLS